MSITCNVCHLLRIHSHGDRLVDERIKASARRQLSQVEGCTSNLLVDEFMGNEPANEIEPNEQGPRRDKIQQPLFDYCKKLFRNRPDSRVQCGICGKNVTIRNRKMKVIATYSINHACVHMGKMIFGCAHCDNTYTCRSSIFMHLWKAHKKGTHPSNYIDSSASYYQEILGILKRCYGNTGFETIISVATKRKMSFRHINTNPLSNFCRKLVKPDENGKIHCSICGLGRVVRGGESKAFISHAQGHLGKPLFKCRQCDLQFSTKCALRTHLKKIHILSSQKENYIDMSSPYEKDMMDILERCFGQQNVVKLEPSDEPKRKCPSQNFRQLNNDPISNACRKLFANHPIDARVRCSLCSTEKKLCTYSPNPTIASIRFITHALVHLAKSIFKCRLCDRSTLTRTAMKKHLVIFHKASASRENFVDKSSKHQKEIIAMLEKCYHVANPELQMSGAPQEKKGPISAIISRSNAGSNTLLAERNIRCNELTRKFQKYGKVTCRVCQQEMVSGAAMRHVTNHLNRVIYHCRFCARSSTSRVAIRMHLKRTHRQPAKNNYEDRSNDFSAELLKLIDDCFDWDQES